MSFSHCKQIQNLQCGINSIQNSINNIYNKYQKINTTQYFIDLQKKLSRFNNNKLLIKVFKINNKIYMSQQEYTNHIMDYPKEDNNVNYILFLNFLTQGFTDRAYNFRQPQFSPNYPDDILINYNSKQFYVYEMKNLSYYLLYYNYNDNDTNKNEFLQTTGCNLQITEEIHKYNTILNILNSCFEFKIIDYKYNYLEIKYDKKFNDLFENTSNIIKELKQNLDKKNEKLRELELKVHYLESQIEKKVTIDYEAIKKRNKNLNNEFKRVAKLMKLG